MAQQTNSMTFGITSLVTGVLSILFLWLPVGNFILAVVAIVFGILGSKKQGSKSMSIAGLSTGGVGLSIAILQGILVFYLIGSSGTTSP